MAISKKDPDIVCARIGDHDIQPSVCIDMSNSDEDGARRASGNCCLPCKTSVAISKKETDTVSAIIGDDDIQPTVIIEITNGDGIRNRARAGGIRVLGCKCPISVSQQYTNSVTG